jgi:hypothetical protein
MQPVSTSLPHPEAVKLSREAAKRNMTRSALLRRLLCNFVRQPLP